MNQASIDLVAIGLSLLAFGCKEVEGSWISGTIPETETSEPPLMLEAEAESENDEFFNADVLEGIGLLDEDGNYSGFGTRAVIVESREVCVIDLVFIGEKLPIQSSCPSCTSLFVAEVQEAYLEEDQGCDEYQLSVPGLIGQRFRLGIAGDALYGFEDGQWLLVGESWVDEQSGELEWVRSF